MLVQKIGPYPETELGQMIEQGVGGRAVPGIGGDHPIGLPAEKNPEVAPGVVAVGGVMSALRAAASKFREYEAHHNKEAQEASARAASFDSAPGAIRGQSSHHAETAHRLEKAAVNGQMAAMCERAIVDLEASLEARPDRAKGPTPPSPSTIFRFGYDHGAMKALWDVMTEEKQEGLLAEGKKAPPGDWAAAWADVRAALAGAK